MDTQEQFARMMEQAVRDALAATDQATAQARAERDAAIAEREAAREARREIERNAERIHEEYFTRRRDQLAEFARTELLRGLARKHLEAGRSTGEIVAWLDVEPAFVEEIAAVVGRVARFRGRPGEPPKRAGIPARNPRLRYENQGRGGTVWYESDDARFGLWWEFAGGDALAIVEVPEVERWVARTGLPIERREEVLRFIGDQVVEDQAGGRGSYHLGHSVMTIYRG